MDRDGERRTFAADGILGAAAEPRGRVLSHRTVFVRSLLFHVAAFALLLPLIPFMPLMLVIARSSSRPFLFAYLRLLAWLLRVICGIDHRIEGREILPPAPFLLASRHESAWEVVFFPLFFDDPAAFAKKEIFSYPLSGWVARRGHIAVDRDGDLAGLRTAFESARRMVGRGRNILIFPSGTRHVGGRDRIRSGVGVLYDLLDVPCVPVTLDSGRCWPPGKWLKYPGTIHVRIGEPIAPGLDRHTFFEVLRDRLAVASSEAPPAERPNDAGSADEPTRA